jgi:hypothetical protein
MIESWVFPVGMGIRETLRELRDRHGLSLSEGQVGR